MPYLQKYLTNFQKLFFVERRGRWLSALGISSAQTFLFSNGNVTTFPTSRKCKNFNFFLYTVPAEMLYLQRYLTNFQKLFFGWKKRKMAIGVGNFKCTDILAFQWQRYNFSNIPKMLKFQFFPYTVPAEMLYLQRYLTNFQKLFFGWKKRKLAIAVENFKCSDIWFSNSNVTTFPISRKCKNFNFMLYTVPAEMLYLQKYLTNFQKLFFRWKKRKVAIGVGNIKCTDFFFFQ